MSDIIKWLAELTPEGKRTVIDMLSADMPKKAPARRKPELKRKPHGKGMLGKTTPYHTAYGQGFKKIYDKIECSGKPIRGSGHQLTPTEFKKVVVEAHVYASEQKDLGYPDVR